MKRNECDVVEWRFDKWSRINRRNGEERGPKMTKNGCKIWCNDNKRLEDWSMRTKRWRPSVSARFFEPF